MERQNKKRGREEKQEEEEKEKKYSREKAAKNHQDNIDFEDDDVDTFSTWEVGVFDFPWLKEGMISKSEDLKFEDAFSSSLGETSTTVGVELSGHCLAPSQFPDDKLEDNLWALEGDEGVDGADCIWSSLLNQPLSTGGV